MPITDWIVRTPTILPIRQGRPGETASQIYSDTSVRIDSETPDCKIYFTSDGSDPDTFGETVVGRESTHRYKGPFKLRPGRRTLKAMAVTRDDHMISSVSTRTFQVMEPCPYQDFDRATLHTEETELDSFTLQEIAAGTLQRYPPHPSSAYTDPMQRDRLSYPSSRETARDYTFSDFQTPRRSRSRSGSQHRARSRSLSPLNRTYRQDETLDAYFNPSSIGASSMTPRRRYDWEHGSDDNETYVSNYFQSRSSKKPYSDTFDDLPTSRVHFGQDTHHLYKSYDDTRLLHHQANSKPHEKKVSREDELAYELGYDVLDRVDTKQLTDEKALTEFTEKGYHSGFDLAVKHLSDTEDDWLLSPRSRSETGSGRMSRKEKHDEDKKKKKKKKEEESRQSSASSFSSLSLSEDENEKKEEVEEEKEQESMEQKEETHTKEIVEEKKLKNAAVPKEQKEKKNREGGTQTTPRSARSDLSKKSGSKKGRLNFINDSGTQINFWGVESEEAVDKITKVMQGDTPKKEAKKPLQPPQVKSKPKLIKVKTQVEAQSAVVNKDEQKDQKSIGSFFKKLFSGFGSSDKEKTDPRSTVREIDGDSTKKKTFEQIVAECRSGNALWEDPDFPAVEASIYSEESPVSGRIEWKRPRDICDEPQMFVGGASRFDIKQGVLGNCWLLAALGSLCSDNKLLRRVIPSDQDFEATSYAGVFRFRFWQYGQWVEVCIDDRLPTQNGQLIFLHSDKTNEFWSPLLEKAYAKINGSYEALSGGLASEGMTDFTGGVCERFNLLEDFPDNMFQIMLKARKAHSLMGCSIDAKPNEIEGELSNGLIIGHAYTISDVKTATGLGRYIKTPNGSADLIRVRNPWGNEAEWNGAWSDKSEEWTSLPDDLKASLGLTFDNDGEFWMSFKDFSSTFQKIEICNLGPDALMDESDDDVKWSCKLLKGAWRKNMNAGGCRNFPKTYFMNPQYHLQVRDGDDDDDDNMGSVIVSLMQKGRRRLKVTGQGNWTIGYDIYAKTGFGPTETLDKRFLDRHGPVVSSPSYINMRQVCGRHKLPVGDYCVVPTTFESNEEGDFVVRVFSEKETGVTEVDTGCAVVQAQPAQVVHSAPSAKIAMNADKLFEKYGGEDKEVDAYELGAILNATFAREFKFGEFDLNVCRSLVAVRDADRTGRLSLEEFKLTWNDLQSWKMVYKQFDQDQNGHFNAFELREALKSLGFQVSNGTFTTLVTKFSNREGFVEFDDFVSCVLNVKSIFDTFQAMGGVDGTIPFTLDQVLQMAVY